MSKCFDFGNGYLPVIHSKAINNHYARIFHYAQCVPTLVSRGRKKKGSGALEYYIFMAIIVS